MRHSTVQFSVTVAFAISQREFDVPWNYPPILESIKPAQANLSGQWLLLMKVAM